MTSPADRLRLGLVGCGRLAELGYVPALTTSRRFELAAIADPVPQRLDHVGRLARGVLADDVATFSGVDALVADAPIDAIVIASPVDSHAAVARIATSAGLPVLVEKPPAPDADGARQLAELGEGVRIGFNRRFVPALAALRQRLAGVESYRSALAISYRRASWSPVSAADDALLDLGPHLVDLARWLLRDHVVEVVHARVAADRAAFELQLGRGSATIAVRTDGVHAERITVVDAATGIEGSYRIGGPVDALRGRLWRRGGGDALVGSLAAQLDAFAAALTDPQRRGWGLASAADGVAVMETIDAVRATADAGDPVLQGGT